MSETCHETSRPPFDGRQRTSTAVARAVLFLGIANRTAYEGGTMLGNRNESSSPISALRRRLNMTQEEFAHAIGVTVSTVNRWENGHIEPSRLARKAMQGLASQAAIPIDLEAS